VSAFNVQANQDGRGGFGYRASFVFPEYPACPVNPFKVVGEPKGQTFGLGFAIFWGQAKPPG